MILNKSELSNTLLAIILGIIPLIGLIVLTNYFFSPIHQFPIYNLIGIAFLSIRHFVKNYASKNALTIAGFIILFYGLAVWFLHLKSEISILNVISLILVFIYFVASEILQRQKKFISNEFLVIKDIFKFLYISLSFGLLQFFIIVPYIISFKPISLVIPFLGIMGIALLILSFYIKIYTIGQGLITSAFMYLYGFSILILVTLRDAQYIDIINTLFIFIFILLLFGFILASHGYYLTIKETR